MKLIIIVWIVLAGFISVVAVEIIDGIIETPSTPEIRNAIVVDEYTYYTPQGAVIFHFEESRNGGAEWRKFKYEGNCYMSRVTSHTHSLTNIPCPDSLK